jgi:putative intracellular protease/amidase
MKNLTSKLKFIFITIMIINATAGNAQNPGQSIKKVLFVVTNVNVAPSNGAAIGVWLEEFASPYYILKDKGLQITIASPKGGVSPVDLRSSAEEAANTYTRRFLADPAAQKELYHTVPLKEINAKDFDAVFYPGGRGPMWDIPEDPYSIQLIESMYAAGKVLAFVCHGPVALKNAKDQQGVSILKGRKIAGFTNDEEAAGNTGGGVPFSLEDMLKSKGANYQKGEKFKAFVVTDGQLISGQNPHSSACVAEKILAALLSK